LGAASVVVELGDGVEEVVVEVALEGEVVGVLEAAVQAEDGNTSRFNKKITLRSSIWVPRLFCGNEFDFVKI
jgi:hypothetical protein